MAEIYHKDENFTIETEENILTVIFYGDLITGDIIDKAIRLRKEMGKGKTYAILGDIRGAKMFSRDARARLAEKDGGENVSAVALLVNSKMQEVIYNFFATLNKPPAPTKLFTNKEKALEWLKKI